MSERPEIRSQRELAIGIAEAVLRGDLGVIEGSRRMLPFRWTTGVDEMDDDFLTLVGVDSETDHLPIGQVRREWDKTALARKDQEIAATEAFYREHVFATCRSIITRFRAI